MRRKFYKKKRFFKKRTYKKKSTATRALRKVNYLTRVVKPEKKFKDFISTGFSISPSPAIFSLVNVAGGSNVNERVGNKLTPRYIFGRFEFISDPTPPYTFIRMIVFQDLQQQLAVTPSMTDVLQSVDTRSPLNVANKGRFKILRDKLFGMNNTTRNFVSFKKNIRLNGTIQYSDATGTNIQQNGIYIAFLSSEPTNPPLGSYYLRLSWTD